MALSFEQTTFETSMGNLGQFQQEDILEFVFAGRSNVGKSSLLNKLMKRKGLAKVSSVPGKTATINFYRINETVRLVDLPGYGYARVAKNEKRKWQTLIGGYFNLERNIGLVVLLLDARHAPSKDDMQMLSFLAEEQLPSIIVFTKSDKLSKRELEARKLAFQQEVFDQYDFFAIYTSTETGEGIDALRGVLNEIAEESEKLAAEEQENFAAQEKERLAAEELVSGTGEEVETITAQLD